MSSIPIAGFADPFSSISHLAGAGAGIAGMVFLLNKGRGKPGNQASLIIYSFCLVFLFAMSGVFHLLEKGTASRYVFQILDYTAIYAMIAGTFTPIHIILFRGMKRWLILLVVWVLAITGLTMTSIFFDDIPKWLSLLFFLGLGWSGYLSFRFIYKHQKTFAFYIAAGGIAYTVGAIVDFTEYPAVIPGVMGPHEIFHVFVIFGALAHWLLIYQIADHGKS